MLRCSTCSYCCGYADRFDACSIQGHTGSTMPDTRDDPEVTLQKKNRAEALRRSLPRLSPEHREIIDLAYYHGKSVKDIAEIVSISETTVKTRMFYARRKLAELVETT